MDSVKPLIKSLFHYVKKSHFWTQSISYCGCFCVFVPVVVVFYFDVYIFQHQLTVSAYFVVPVLSSIYLVFLQLSINFACWASIILKLSTPCILAGNFFFLFQRNSHNMLNTYIYHLFRPTCFSVFTPPSGRALCYLLKNYMLFAMLLHKKE